MLFLHPGWSGGSRLVEWCKIKRIMDKSGVSSNVGKTAEKAGLQMHLGKSGPSGRELFRNGVPSPSPYGNSCAQEI